MILNFALTNNNVPQQESLKWRDSCTMLLMTQRYLDTQEDLKFSMAERYEKRAVNIELPSDIISSHTDYGMVYQKLRKHVWQGDLRACKMMDYATQCEKNMRWFEGLSQDSEIISPAPHNSKLEQRTTHGLMRFMARNMIDVISGNTNHQIDLCQQSGVTVEKLQEIVSSPIAAPKSTSFWSTTQTENAWMKRMFQRCYNDFLSLGDDLKGIVQQPYSSKSAYHS
jgi:hypothetical protein